MASLVGVHPQTVSKWERGLTRPTLYQFVTLDLLNREPKPKAMSLHEALQKYGVGGVLTIKLSPR